MRTIAVTGGRTANFAPPIWEALDNLHAAEPIGLLLHGACAGADAIAANWAQFRGVEAAAYPADWNLHGRAAGPRRNRTMLEMGSPSLLVAFAGGRGTADCVRQARALGIEVLEVK